MNEPAADANPGPAAGTPAARAGVRPRLRGRSRQRGNDSGRARAARKKASPPAPADRTGLGGRQPADPASVSTSLDDLLTGAPVQARPGEPGPGTGGQNAGSHGGAESEGSERGSDPPDAGSQGGRVAGRGGPGSDPPDARRQGGAAADASAGSATDASGTDVAGAAADDQILADLEAAQPGVPGPVLADPDGSEPDTDAAAAADDGVLSGQIIISTGLMPRTDRIALAGLATDVAGPPDSAELAWIANAIRAVLAWAGRRHVGLTSACGIFVVLAICAATWFSAGTRSDNLRGVAALWAGFLALKAGQRLAWPPRPGPSRAIAPPRRRAARAGTSAGTSAGPDGVILRPGANRQAAAQARRRAPVSAAWSFRSSRRQAVTAAWLAALGSSVAESVIYAGLAAGAVAERWTGVWPLAVAVLGLVAVRNLMSACSTPPGLGDNPGGPVRQLAAAVLTMPIGGRILLVGIVAPIWGPRAALLAVLEWSIISIGYGLAGRPARGVTGDQRGLDQHGQLSLLRRVRDDGALARALGALVRGSLLPLPPAVLGLLAVSALALLGLHDLPTVLLVGPAIVMLLAAPGSSHPHTGRLDWLVPSLLLSAQIFYLTAVGVGARVPGPVIYALIAALLLRYADLAFPGRPVLLARPKRAGEVRGERGTGLGWEGRLLVAGLAAATGIATFAYLALTAYLGLLICAKVMTSSLAPREEKHL